MTRRTAVALTCAVLTVLPATAQPAEERLTAAVRASPLTVELRLARSTAPAGQPTTAHATVTNHALQPLADAVVVLRVDEASIGVRGGAARELGTLGSQRTARATWQLCAHPSGAEPLTYLVLAQAHATEDDEEVLAESRTAALTVTSGQATGCPPGYP